jgi:pimeloyl-ACP methyl ester carboxylesterase
MPAIVMVHGAFCGGWVFDRFRQPFARAGYEVLAPDLRGHGAGAPGDSVLGLSMSDYADDVAELCRGLDEPPILVGHSMGGLVCQMASRRAELDALVLLAPSPPWGVAGWSMEEAVTAVGLQVLGPFTGVVEPNIGLMRSYSLDRLATAEAEPILERLRPESGRAVRETLNWWLDPLMTTSLGPGPLATPALVLAGTADRAHPAATVRQTAERIGGTFLPLPEMSHWLVGEPGWEAVAGLALEWLERRQRAAA